MITALPSKLEEEIRELVEKHEGSRFAPWEEAEPLLQSLRKEGLNRWLMHMLGVGWDQSREWFSEKPPKKVSVKFFARLLRNPENHEMNSYAQRAPIDELVRWKNAYKTAFPGTSNRGIAEE